ncbi:hypothetical protein D9M69_691550 [compost metagenome]
MGGEAVFDFTRARHLAVFDDLPRLRPQFRGARLRLALGFDGAVAFGFLDACPFRIALDVVGCGRSLAVSRLVLLARDLGQFRLLDQACLEQLFL